MLYPSYMYNPYSINSAPSKLHITPRHPVKLIQPSPSTSPKTSHHFFLSSQRSPTPATMPNEDFLGMFLPLKCLSPLYSSMSIPVSIFRWPSSLTNPCRRESWWTKWKAKENDQLQWQGGCRNMPCLDTNLGGPHNWNPTGRLHVLGPNQKSLSKSDSDT